jgi:hypothetical protein
MIINGLEKDTEDCCGGLIQGTLSARAWSDGDKP